MGSKKNDKTIKNYIKLKRVLFVTLIVCLPFLFFGSLGIYIIAFPFAFPIIGIFITIFDSLVRRSNKTISNVCKTKGEEVSISNSVSAKYTKKPFVIMLIVIVVAICICSSVILFDNQNSDNIILSGYYYEKLEQDTRNRDIYYFEEDGTCFIKHESINNKSTTIVLSEKYTHCTYALENGSVKIDVYDNNKYSNLVVSEVYSLENIENGILLNGVEFLNRNYENVSGLKENVLEQYSYKCATQIAEKYDMSEYCTSWEKISDGFYNYSCGIIIRTYIDDIGISYDTYSSASGNFTTKDYCYKIIKDVESPIDVSNEIITKKVPVKIILTGKLADEYKIETIESNFDEVSITGYKYRLDAIDDFSVYVDVNNLKVNKEFKIKLKKPVYLKNIDLDEILVDVRINNVKTKEFIVNGTDIITRGVNDNLRVSAVEPLDQIKVKVIGTDNTLKKIDDIQLYIDLDKYTMNGIYDADLKLNLDESIYDYIIEPSTIKIRVN